MIPLSSKIDKYKRILSEKQKSGRPCDIIHIMKLDNGKESAFLKITDKSIIASLNHNQFEFADDGYAFYEYIKNEVLKSK